MIQMSAPSGLTSRHIVLKVTGVPLLFQEAYCMKIVLEILTANLYSNSKSNNKGHLSRDSVSAPSLLPRKRRAAFFSHFTSNLITTGPWSMW